MHIPLIKTRAKKRAHTNLGLCRTILGQAVSALRTSLPISNVTHLSLTIMSDQEGRHHYSQWPVSPTGSGPAVLYHSFTLPAQLSLFYPYLLPFFLKDDQSVTLAAPTLGCGALGPAWQHMASGRGSLALGLSGSVVVVCGLSCPVACGASVP